MHSNYFRFIEQLLRLYIQTYKKKVYGCISFDGIMPKFVTVYAPQGSNHQRKRLQIFIFTIDQQQ